MSKWVYNYESGQYEDIDRDGYSWTSHRYVFNWDDSEYRREEEEKKRLEEEEQKEMESRRKSLWEDDD